MTTRFTTILALLAVCSLGMAQPPADSATTQTKKAERGQRAGGPTDQPRSGMAGPYAKLNLAQRLDSLTQDQKDKLAQFKEESKAEGEALQKEFRETMAKARETTDRDARRTAMQGVREKFQAAETKVDSFLEGVLTAEQLTEIKSNATKLRDRAGDRVRRFRDSSTTASASQLTTKDREKRGDRSDRKNRPGKDGRRNNKNKSAPANADSPAADTTTTGTPNNPFAGQ